MLRGCDAAFFVIYASSGKQRYVSPIYSMRPVPKSNARYAIINASHVIELFCRCCHPMTHFYAKRIKSAMQKNTKFIRLETTTRQQTSRSQAISIHLLCLARQIRKYTSTYAIYILSGFLLWSLSRILCLCIYWIRMRKLLPQIGITTIRHFRLKYAFVRALLLGQLVVLKILLPSMPHLDAQTGCRAGRRRTCHMDHQTRVRASPKADGSSG